MSAARARGSAEEAVEQRVLLALLAHQRHAWEQGLAAQAAAELGRTELVTVMAHDAVARRLPDGRLGELDATAAVNGGALAEAVGWLARTTGDERAREAYERQIGWLAERAPRAADGTLFHLTSAREVWADTVYMTVPALFAAGRADVAMAQVDGHRARLQDPATGLYAAAWDEDGERLVRPQRWGTANGWVAAGLARCVRLEGATPVRAALAAHAKQVIDACLERRREDGLFPDVLDDPGSFAETNLAQMLAYACLVGVADGWLPHSYVALGRDLRRTGTEQLDAFGLVRGASAAPSFDRPGTSPEAQAFWLLAAAAEHRLASRRSAWH